MTTILRQSTQIVVRVGPFMDATDGVTPETGITLGAADQAEALKAAGAATVDISGATWAAVTGASGWYDLTLTTSHTDTIGSLVVVVQDSSVCLPVFATFQVVEEAAYDAIFAASASPATTSGAVGSVTGAVGSVTGAVGSVTGNVGGNVTGSVGSVIGAVGSVTGNLGGNVSGSVGSVVGAVGSVTGNVGGNVSGSVGSVVGAVGSVTGNVGGNVTGSVASVLGGINISSGTITTLDGLDTAQDSQHATTQAAVATVDGVVDAILVDTAVIGAAGAGLTALPWNAAWDAEVQSEVTDALNAYDPPTNTEMVASFTEIKGATWATTDTLEAIRDRGDAAWLTATGFSTHSAADVWAAGTRTLTASSDPTAAAIADAVWDEARSGHTTSGTYGESHSGMVSGTAATGTLSTTQMSTNLSEATNDHYIGRTIVWITGNLAGQASDVTDYAGSGGILTFTAVTEAPANGDRFVRG